MPKLREYVYVVHATEEIRRKRYHGCVSRQTLRAQLRRDAFAGIRAQYRGEEHGIVRKMAADRAKREYHEYVDMRQ